MPYFLPAIETWSDWSATFDDAELWRPVIDAICDREDIRYQQIEIPRSNTNAVFILDRQLVVKIYSPFWSEFEVEETLLRVLNTSRTVPVPEVVAAARYQDRVSWNYLIVKYCSGLTLDAVRPDIARGDLLSIAAQVGRMTRALHETPLTPLDGINTGESWDDLVDRRRRETPSELVRSGIITSGVADSLLALLEEVAASSMRAPHVVVHGDMESDHILLERAEGTWKIASIIDFGDAKVGVRDYEWMPLWLGMFDRDIEAMRVFLEAYDRSLLADEDFPRRVMAWTLLHDFGSDAVAELVQKTNAPTPIETLAELRRTLWPGLTNPARA
ncbi:MAG: aminoglycoside phosphotransferase family protein [Dehalococcoidia bacterium]|nr:aminoglycoside phosphotransferase family protein [Dehalococcoidia bacterium]